MRDDLRHGGIMGGVIATPDVAAALGDYRDRLGLTLVEEKPLDPVLAAAWDAPALAGVPTATLQPTSGAPCFIRLVEQPVPAGFKPNTSFGWNSWEIAVQDVMDWPAKLAGSGFDIVGPPRRTPELTAFIAMQMLGRGGEMLYLNEALSNTDTTDLLHAASPVDAIFIVILGVADREAAVAWYRDRLRLDVGVTHTIPYSVINRAFGRPMDTLSRLTMVMKGRMPIVEVDDYPEESVPRPTPPGGLPAGNALVTLAVDNLDALDLAWITPPTRREGPLYAGCRAATTKGPAGELLELVEI